VLNYFSQTKAGGDNVLNVRGTLKLRMGATTSAADMTGIGTLVTSTTSVGNTADQTEDTLQTYSLPASALVNTNACLYIYASGSTGASGDSKDVKLYFGATVIAQVLANAANAKGWEAEAYVCRTGSNTQYASGYAQVDTTASTILVTTPAETETGAIVIKTTGKDNTANTANSVVSKLLIVQGAK
jgi:hypothetical protein